MLTPDQIAAFRRMYEAGIPPKSQPMFAEICEQAAKAAELNVTTSVVKMVTDANADRDRWRALAKRLGVALENFDYCGYEEANAVLADLRAMEDK
jgi:hypothetical protein